VIRNNRGGSRKGDDLVDQHQNFQNAVLKKKARIEEINLILAQPRPSGHPAGSRRRVIEERLHLEQAVAELEREDRRLQSQNAATLPFLWEQLDQRLLLPKLEELSEEMQKRSIEATNKTASDTRESGNTAGYFPRLFEAQRQLTDEWAQKLYDVHCEVWRTQGHSISADFIRAVSNKAIPEFLVGRKGAVEHGAELWSARTRHLGAAIPLGMWTQMMIKLRAKWARDLEAEAVASQYRSSGQQKHPVSRTVRQSTGDSTGIEIVSGASMWRGFRSEFKALAAEELILDPGNRRDRWLRAFVDYKYVKCDFGTWHISSGPNEDFRASFETLATRAGISLGRPLGADPLEFWLHHLFLDLLKHGSDQLFAAKENEGGVILRVCEASATYCARLEKETLEKSSHKPVLRRRVTVADVSPTAKLGDAVKFPTMTVPEVMEVLTISRASVFRFLNEGRLDRPGLNKKPGKRSKALILTASVKKMLTPSEE